MTTNDVTRRTLIASGLGAAGALSALSTAAVAAAQDHGKSGGKGGPIAASLMASIGKDGNYTLPPLPYAYDALSRSIDAETMQLHHDKHHAGYVKGANDALSALAGVRSGQGETGSITDLTEKLSFNLCGHLLHSVFWADLGPDGGGKPGGDLGKDLEAQFGSFEAFQTHFGAAASQVQGNGWGVLAFEPLARKLIVLQARNHQINGAWGAIPLLVLDVWEHAYYLKYRNVRADYVKNFWNVVNWSAVNDWYTLLKASHPAV